MKKYLLKSFALLAMLFSALAMSAATQYCDVLLETADGDVKYSLYRVSGNTYGIQVVPQDGMALTNIYNSNIGVNQTSGAGITITQWTISNNIATAIFQTALETSVPTNFFTAYICFNKTGGKTGRDLVEVTIPASDIDWTTTCDASDEGGGETGVPVLESVELFGSAQNFVLLTPTASDDKGVTSYLIAKSGGAETEVTSDATTGQIKIASLTLGTTYTYTVKAKDADGNVSNAKEITFSTLDNVFCEEEVLPGTAQEFANQKLTFTAKKVSDTETYFAISSSTSTLTKISTVTFYSNAGETGTYGGGVLPEDYVLKDGWTLTDNTLSKTVTWTTYPTAPFRASINATRSKNSDTEKTTINWMYTMDVSNTCGEEPEPPTEVYDVNFALTANGSSVEATSGDAAAAIDNNTGSRWESAHSDPQTWILDLGQARIFNTLEIVWEGAYGKTFTVSVSDDKETWKPIWTVEGQQLAGFPYTQTQKIDKTTARYIQFHGTARGTGYGYSFWEFRVFLLGETTLTTLEATPATQYMHMGEENVITITAKDQIGKVMENAGEVAYTISPVEAGVINDNVFTPSQNGTATIVAAIGDVKSAPFDIITYVSQLASLEAKPTNGLAKVGDGLAINVTAKDQNGQVIATPDGVTYTITPADAGTITGNVYTPAKIGAASIVASIGEVAAAAFEVVAYDGENLAFSADRINANKVIAQSGLTDGSDKDAWYAVDGNDGSVWQGSLTNGTAGDEAARTFDSWFVVDFGAEYDVNLVSINFEGACSQEYHVDFSADNATWNVAYNHVGNNGINAHTKYIYGSDLQNTTKVRYARFYSTKAATQWGVKMFEFKVYGTESASLTKTVSASVNDAVMGAATVTQEGIAVTEVATGSEVTFTATANEGYLFLNWSNGNTNPSFTTTVDAAMHLTANFRALGNIYCNTEMTVDGHTIYVTMKRTAPETYQLIVRSEENLTKFGGTNFYRPNNKHVINLSDEGVLSDDKHILTATFRAETIPYMVDPLFVIFEGIGEKRYPKLDNIEYDVECSEDVTVTGLALDPASVSIMVGGSQTLKAIFTPAHAFGEKLEWISSNDAVATVDANGVVKAVAVGNAVITAKLVSNPAITATCNITVTNFTAHTFYGYGSQNDVDFAYNLTYNEDGTVTIVADVLTNNPGLGVPSFSIDNEWKDMTKNADGTYTRTSEKTFSIGQTVNCFLYAPYTGGVGQLDFNYIVGSENTRPEIPIASVTINHESLTLTPNNTIQLSSIIAPLTTTVNKEINWISSNDAVVTVDANGVVKAVAVGDAMITATLVSNPSFTATCNVIVTAFTAHTFYGYGSNGGVDFAYNLTYNEDGTVTVVAEVLTNKGTLGYNQSFSIDGEWKDLTKNPDGTYTRTSEKTFSMGQEVSCYFYAPIEGGGAGRIEFTYIVGSENTRPAIPVTGVSINHESITITVGETTQLSGAVAPMTADNKAVTWKSSNEAIATVVDGLVTAIAPGNATITITSVEGNYRATCSIKVLAAISELPPAPIWHKSQVKAIYSATYDADCDFGEWNSGTIYTQDTYGKKFTTNTTGYFGLVGFAYDCTDMQYLHLDVWCANSTTLGIVPIHGGAEIRVTKEIAGGQWNAIEIPLTAYEGVTDWSNITQLKIDNIKEQNIWLNNIYFYTNVTPTIVDENTDLTSLTPGICDLTLIRNFVMDGDWNTISLPFALNASQIEAIFGTGTIVQKLSSSELKSNTEIDLVFEEVTSIEAATPYLIKPKKNVNEGVFLENVTINTTPNILEAGITKMIPVLKTQVFTGEDNSFFLGANETLYKQSTSGKIMAMRAYFQFSTLTPEQLRNVRARVVFNENTETNVDNITIDKAPIKVIQNGQLIIIRNGVKYNVQGQKL